MDVTSLLNVNSLAAEQQRRMEKSEVVSKTPTRNRTPWDAGGYSLPINTVSHSTHNTPPQQNIHIDESHQISASTPSSPRHKFSDSRSSLSSFTSSLQSSAAHSRFSSTSTTITQPIPTLGESLSPVSNLKLHEMDLSQLAPLDVSRPQPRGSLSPTESLDALALVADRLADQEVISSISEERLLTIPEQGPSLGSDIKRSGSPSDALMIKPSRPTGMGMMERTTALPSLKVITGDHELNGGSQLYSR